MAQINGGAHDGRVAFVLHVPDKAFVNLDRVYGQTLEVDQGRVADPEVINGNAYTHFPEAGKDPYGAFLVRSESAFHDLNFQVVRRYGPRLTHLGEGIRQSGALHVPHL